ncbi:TPT1 [Candida jiufengensis]|uniref:TPT1 n=1 Tax=Candida jiufengensis TaxID=497108 RepID=UPI0022252555|nr:TPT1 [Candida jiufengensis]KAI5953130.1 TPT1 [Candida jiufengensis]
MTLDPKKRDVLISKSLSYLLRHGAEKEKLNINNQGYIPIPDILNHQKLKSFKTTKEDLFRIVEENDKKRFTIDLRNQLICANQGHSLAVVNNENLIKLSKEELLKLNIYHGTYKKKISLIKSSGGLKKMNRNHIHFTCDEYQSISGIRKTANVLIYLNIEKCLDQGFEFYKSLNNVILSSGDSNGIIQWEFISKIVDLNNGSELDLDAI